MSDDALEAATWIPRRLRDVMVRTLEQSGRQARALLPFALATGTQAGVEFWNELCVSILRKDTERRFSDELLRHAIQVAGAKTAGPPALPKGRLDQKLILPVTPK